MKKQTWQEKMAEYAAAVREGHYGIVRGEFKASSGWGDGVRQPHFALERAVEGEGRFVVAKATESGVFRQSNGGGWSRLESKEERMRR